MLPHDAPPILYPSTYRCTKFKVQTATAHSIVIQLSQADAGNCNGMQWYAMVCVCVVSKSAASMSPENREPVTGSLLFLSLKPHRLLLHTPYSFSTYMPNFRRPEMLAWRCQPPDVSANKVPRRTAGGGLRGEYPSERVPPGASKLRTEKSVSTYIKRDLAALLLFLVLLMLLYRIDYGISVRLPYLYYLVHRSTTTTRSQVFIQVTIDN